jgi:hypothetical protein
MMVDSCWELWKVAENGKYVEAIDNNDLLRSIVEDMYNYKCHGAYLNWLTGFSLLQLTKNLHESNQP